MAAEIRSKESGGSTPSTCSPNQASTPARSIPSGASAMPPVAPVASSPIDAKHMSGGCVSRSIQMYSENTIHPEKGLESPLVDAYRNPYTPGAGSRPAAMTGREVEIERFRVVLGRLSNGAPEQSLVIHGLRGVGKTVLLNKLEEVAIEAGWATSFGEVRRGDDLRAVMARALYNTIRQLDARRMGRRTIARLKSAFASFSATVTSEGSVRFGVEVTPAQGTADSGHLETDLVEMFLELGEAAADSQTGVAVLLDELQLAATEDLEALVAAIHRANQKALPIAVVAAGLPTLRGALAEAKTYAERLFSFPELGALCESDARDALVLPARAQGVEYDEDALRLMLDRAEGYPYFLQEWGLAYGMSPWQTRSAPRMSKPLCPTWSASWRRTSSRSGFRGPRPRSVVFAQRWRALGTGHSKAPRLPEHSAIRAFEQHLPCVPR